jgi:hypothetical protein
MGLGTALEKEGVWERPWKRKGVLWERGLNSNGKLDPLQSPFGQFSERCSKNKRVGFLVG